MSIIYQPTGRAGLFRRLSQGLWWDRAWQLTMGCTEVSPACDNCWACRESHMRACNPNPKIAERHAGLTRGPDLWTGEVRPRWDNLKTPLAVKAPAVWAIWNDLFHEAIPDDFIDQAFVVMAWRLHHVFIVPTKRAERMADYFASRMSGDPWAEAADAMADMIGLEDHPFVLEPKHIPLPNVIGMVTAENQKWANERVPHLLATPWAWRAVSYEPALGPVDFAAAGGLWADLNNNIIPNGHALGGGLDWVICGGESGPGARPMHPDWARKVRDDCAMAGVRFMFKQWGEWGPLEGSDAGHPTPCCFWRPGHRAADANGWVAGITSEQTAHMVRPGKPKTGRLLDGKEHLGVPEVFKRDLAEAV